MNSIFKRLAILFLLFFSIAKTEAQHIFFSDKNEEKIKLNEAKKIERPSIYRTLHLDTIALRSFLKNVPAETTLTDRKNAPVIELPMPKGSARFRIWETVTMAPELAAQFPEIKTYTGQGIDDKTATIKIDWTPLGFHAMILSSLTGTVLIDPFSNEDITNYIVYFKNDYKKKDLFNEVLPKKLQENLSRPIIDGSILGGSGTQLKTYRLAVACTHQYAETVSSPSAPTVALALSAITTAINRVNAVYESELSIHFTLVSNEALIIFPTAGIDPFTGNNNATVLIDESQTVITNKIGTANFDIGHTFSTGAGGVATVGCVCNDAHKAEGVTGTTNPIGDPFVVDYVCHELGHQFNANHSFNSNTDFCGAAGQWNATTNAEPGSGSTIMGYSASPAICGLDNLQSNSMAVFHAVSFNEINTYTTTGLGSGCATKTNTGNSIPAVNAGVDYTIPKSTPFILSGSATDGNNDALTYSWEQINVGAPASAWNNPSGTNAPLFRSFLPLDSGVRYFPKLTDVVNNVSTIGELLPTIARTMNFRLTVRDNRSGGGGVNYDEMNIAVTNDGPFTITYPTTSGISWKGDENRTIIWNVANTNISPINAANISIELSIDGGFTYPITIMASTANDGSENIIVPNLATSSARIRIKAVGNIFYDLSDNNFTITYTTPSVWGNFLLQKTAMLTSLLHWEVSNDDSAFYEIERSGDSINFNTIGKMNFNLLHSYTFEDTKPLINENYYRIKKIDKNGTITYSDVKNIFYDEIKFLWSIFPNPLKENLFVISTTNAEKTIIQIYDATGKLILDKKYLSVTRGQQLHFNMNGYPSGSYILKIITDKTETTKKLILEK